MKKSFRIALATAAVAAGVALAAPSSATAQVRFSGSFPAPHGRISVDFGDPFFEVGSFVPSSYRVIRHPRYGHGFYYRSRWIPVRSYGSRWLVCDAPVVYSGAYDDGYYAPYDGYYSRPYYQPYAYSYRPYVYSRPYGYSGYYGHRGWGHGWDRGWDRGHGGWGGWRH
ncbi:MAG: hypothetical protein LC796_04765 [Acidobacteria bacterium]|nr:hypothetical protein [Acidobacteriota bacterium]MCA1609630.1 hypothetical protein [Acidobacteriota bacterium]